MARLDTSKIAGYETMSAEEKLAALESYEYDDYADALKNAELEVNRYKNAVSKANTEAKQWKDKHNALLSDEEKAKEETQEKYEAMQNELTSLRQEKQISDYASQYIELGYNKELAYETATAQATNDFNKVMANHKFFLENQRKVMQEEALKHQPSLTAGTPPTAEQLEESEINSIVNAALHR